VIFFDNGVKPTGEGDVLLNEEASAAGKLKAKL
jgi:hypothetical protein